jgi:hypothetical protein
MNGLIWETFIPCWYGFVELTYAAKQEKGCFEAV